VSYIGVDKNREIKDFFISFAKKKGYVLDGRILKKGYVVIVIMHAGRRIRLFDTNPKHKFSYIALPLTPTNELEANYFYDSLELAKKEMGSKAWSDKIKREKENV